MRGPFIGAFSGAWVGMGIRLQTGLQLPWAYGRLVGLPFGITTSALALYSARDLPETFGTRGVRSRTCSPDRNLRCRMPLRLASGDRWTAKGSGGKLDLACAYDMLTICRGGQVSQHALTQAIGKVPQQDKVDAADALHIARLSRLAGVTIWVLGNLNLLTKSH